MTKRDFFILMIKLFGLYFLVKALFSLSILRFDHFGPFDLFAVMVGIGIIGGLFWLLTFKAGELIDFLKLTRGFSEDRMELGNIKTGDIIKTGTFIIGGLMIIDSVPGFLSNTFWAFKGDFGSQEKFNLILKGLNILFGYLIATNYEFVAKLLQEKESR